MNDRQIGSGNQYQYYFYFSNFLFIDNNNGEFRTHEFTQSTSDTNFFIHRNRRVISSAIDFIGHFKNFQRTKINTNFASLAKFFINLNHIPLRFDYSFYLFNQKQENLLCSHLQLVYAFHECLHKF